MKNPKAIQEIINEAKKIKKNNFNNMNHLNSIKMLVTSSDTGASKDSRVSDAFYRLQEKIEDANILTTRLMSHLEGRHHGDDSLR